MDFRDEAKIIGEPEEMAKAYLARYYKNRTIKYPISPFRMLNNEGILLSLMNSKNLEGVYIPAETDDDISVVGINVNQRITRQRFTAAHELCHHFRDYDKITHCPIGAKTNEEKFADAFAAALLMPLDELKKQVDKRKGKNKYVSFDSVLEIADYFGVSFRSCLNRIAYGLGAIEGDIDPTSLSERVGDYQPERKRKARHLTHTNLYADLIDNCGNQFKIKLTAHAKLVFQNDYIYNDSRIEGLAVSLEQAAAIVTDLRLNAQSSVYCSEDNEALLSIAGHYDMYNDIFEDPKEDSLDVYSIFRLNSLLFKYYPNAEYGGGTRQTNTLVQGAKFETVDYAEIHAELIKVAKEVNYYFDSRANMTPSEYIKHVARVHHRITVIHPFSDGNGRTSRAFMNMQLVKAGLQPLYIRAEDKQEYIDALAYADRYGIYDDLYEVLFKAMLKAFADFNRKQ